MQTQIQVLSEDEKAQVHERTLKVLSTVGMRCDTAEGRRILAAAGADVDEATRMVRFPPELVESLLAQATRRFTVQGRRPDWSFAVGAGEFTLLADGGATTVFDAQTGERRPTTQADWLAATRLLDAFDDVGFYWCPIEYAADYERAGGFVRYYADVFATFGKHVQDSFGTPELAPWLKEVLDIVFGGPEAVRERMPLSFLITPASPLTIEHDYTQTWLELRDYGLPVAVMPMPLQGATAPGSRLGTLLAANCETIGTLCLVQAAAPGTPVFYSPVVATMDPRTGALRRRRDGTRRALRRRHRDGSLLRPAGRVNDQPDPQKQEHAHPHGDRKHQVDQPEAKSPPCPAQFPALAEAQLAAAVLVFIHHADDGSFGGIAHEGGQDTEDQDDQENDHSDRHEGAMCCSGWVNSGTTFCINHSSARAPIGACLFREDAWKTAGIVLRRPGTAAAAVAAAAPAGGECQQDAKDP